jgi:hypothetical protein
MVWINKHFAAHKPFLKWENFVIYAKDVAKVSPIRSLVEHEGFQYSESAPDFVITIFAKQRSGRDSLI